MWNLRNKTDENRGRKGKIREKQIHDFTQMFNLRNTADEHREREGKIR